MYQMISADTPVVFAKACEMFIMELTLRAWMHTQENKRRTLQRNDVANAIRDEDLLVFLKDIVPMEIYQVIFFFFSLDFTTSFSLIIRS